MSKTTDSAAGDKSCCPIVELRQYTLHPGKRDTLIELFEKEFLTSQEAVGMTIIGQFRDLNDPDRFVWLRGFPDMTARAQSLKDFYGGPIWKAHSRVANATMIDSDNVLLLHPARTGSGFPLQSIARNAETSRGLVIANIYYFESPVKDDFIDFFEEKMRPLVGEAGAVNITSFVTESSPNTFPALPVRERENVFVWFACFPDQRAYDNYSATLSKSPRWRKEVAKTLPGRLQREPELLMLAPASRSRLHG